MIHSYQQLANEFEKRERRAWKQQISFLQVRLKKIMAHYDLDLDDQGQIDEFDISRLDTDDALEVMLIQEEIEELEQYVK